MVECWVICLAAIHTPNGSSTVQLIMSVVYGDRQSHICGGSDHCACLTGSHMTFAPTFFTYFPVLFSCTFFPYFFPSILFPVLFQKSRRLKYNVLKYQLVVFLVHVVISPCEISIQTSPVGLPLDGWDSRMCDLKGPKMNLRKAKED